MAGICRLCERPSHGKGLCMRHYGRLRRYGDPDYVPAKSWVYSRELPFWSRVKKSDGCWEWMGNRGPRGYGTIKVAGKVYRTHRYAYALVNGPIPEGYFVCHRCDNPPCCRPDHLFLGTAKDNNHDMMRKGRYVNGSALHPEKKARGLRCGTGRIPFETIVAIRSDRIEKRIPYGVLAVKYAVSKSHVARIVRDLVRSKE